MKNIFLKFQFKCFQIGSVYLNKEKFNRIFFNVVGIQDSTIINYNLKKTCAQQFLFTIKLHIWYAVYTHLKGNVFTMMLSRLSYGNWSCTSIYFIIDV